MRWTVLLGLPLAGMLSVAAANEGENDAGLEAQCRRTETTIPASCGCTVARGRAAGLNDRQLASMFRDDGKSDPLPPALYEKFWLKKIECLGEATNFSVPPVPPPPVGQAKAKVAPSADAAIAPTSAAAAQPGTPIPLTLQYPDSYDRVFYFTPDQVRAMLAALEGTTWRRTFEDGSVATYAFQPDRVIVQAGRNYTNRYLAVVAGEPGYQPKDYDGIQSDPNGMFKFDAPRVKPYLTLLGERGRQEGFWLGYWGGRTLYVGHEWRAGQFYSVDRLELVSGTPRAFDPAAVAASDGSVGASSTPLSDRIGSYGTYPGELGAPGGCDRTLLVPSATIRTARQLAAADGGALRIYLAENMISETESKAVISIDGRSVVLDPVAADTHWRGGGVDVLYEANEQYAPENNGIGYSAGTMTVRTGGEEVRLPALAASVC